MKNLGFFVIALPVWVCGNANLQAAVPSSLEQLRIHADQQSLTAPGVALIVPGSTNEHHENDPQRIERIAKDKQIINIRRHWRGKGYPTVLYIPPSEREDFTGGARSLTRSLKEAILWTGIRYLPNELHIVPHSAGAALSLRVLQTGSLQLPAYPFMKHAPLNKLISWFHLFSPLINPDRWLSSDQIFDIAKIEDKERTGDRNLDPTKIWFGLRTQIRKKQATKEFIFNRSASFTMALYSLLRFNLRNETRIAPVNMSITYSPVDPTYGPEDRQLLERIARKHRAHLIPVLDSDDRFGYEYFKNTDKRRSPQITPVISPGDMHNLWRRTPNDLVFSTMPFPHLSTRPPSVRRAWLECAAELYGLATRGSNPSRLIDSL